MKFPSTLARILNVYDEINDQLYEQKMAVKIGQKLHICLMKSD